MVSVLKQVNKYEMTLNNKTMQDKYRLKVTAIKGTAIKARRIIFIIESIQVL